jgi:hypothetical protein
VAAVPYSWDLVKDGVSQSMLQTWLVCREKARLMVEEGWTSPPAADAFSFGTMLHEALEELYTGSGVPSDNLVDTAVLAAFNRQKAGNPRMSGEIFQALTDQQEVVRILVKQYFRYYRDDFKKIRWLEREKEFDLPFYGVRIRGKRDGAFRAGKGKGRLFLFETKTKSRFDEEELMDWLPLDLQVNVYLWSLKQDYKEMPAGVLYNIVRKPGLRIGKSEPNDAFLKRIRQDVAHRPDWYFNRFEVAVLDKELRHWEESSIPLIGDFEQWARTRDVPTRRHYRNPTACIGKYGACDCLGVCARGDFSRLQKTTRPFRELELK